MKAVDDQVGHYVGSKEESLKNKTRRRRIQGKLRTRTLCNLVVPGQISRDLAPNIRAGREAAEDTHNLSNRNHHKSRARSLQNLVSRRDHSRNLRHPIVTRYFHNQRSDRQDVRVLPHRGPRTWVNRSPRLFDNRCLMPAYRIPSTLSPIRRALPRSTLDNWRRLWEICRHKIGHRQIQSCHRQLHRHRHRQIWEARFASAPMNSPRTATPRALPSQIYKEAWR